jgi:hypothetical protein
MCFTKIKKRMPLVNGSAILYEVSCKSSTSKICKQHKTQNPFKQPTQKAFLHKNTEGAVSFYKKTDKYRSAKHKKILAAERL